MPLRPVDRVSYTGDAGGAGWCNLLYVDREKLPLDVKGGIDMARRYLTSPFIGNFFVQGHGGALPNLQPLMARGIRIKQLFLRKCNFSVGEGNALEKVLSGCRFKELILSKCQLPGWQLNDDLLRDLGSAGLDLVDFAGNAPLNNNENILDYCFSSELEAMQVLGRYLAVTEASITPALLQKCIQTSAKSKVTGRVTLVIHGLEDVRGGQMAAFGDDLVGSSSRRALYEFPDQGNRMRLKVRFTRDWWGTRMELRLANKDDKGIDCDW